MDPCLETVYDFFSYSTVQITVICDEAQFVAVICRGFPLVLHVAVLAASWTKYGTDS